MIGEFSDAFQHLKRPNILLAVLSTRQLIRRDVVAFMKV